MTGFVEYPPEMVAASQRIVKAALGISAQMEMLNKDQKALQELSSGAHAAAFAEVQDAWNRSGLANSEKFRALGTAVEDAHLTMTEWDHVMGNRFRGGHA